MIDSLPSLLNTILVVALGVIGWIIKRLIERLDLGDKRLTKIEVELAAQRERDAAVESRIGKVETATTNYFTNATTNVETFYLQGAGDGGGSVRTSSFLLVPLYTNASGNKVVKLSWSNMAVISGRYWI